MHRILFNVSLFLALVYAGLCLVEAWQYQSSEKMVDQEKTWQEQLVFAQRQDAFNRDLLKRLALESQNDFAIAEILNKHHVRVVLSGAQAVIPAPMPPSDVTGPASPDKLPEPVPPPAPSTP